MHISPLSVQKPRNHYNFHLFLYIGIMTRKGL